MALSTNQFKNGNHIEVDGHDLQDPRVPARQARQGRRVRAHEAAPRLRRQRDRPHLPGRREVPRRCAPRRARCSSSTPTAPTRTSWTPSPSSRSRSPRPRWRRRCAGSTPSSEVDVLFIDDEPSDLQLPSAVDLEVTADRPGPARRHGLRRRHEAGDARDRRGDPGAAVRRAGRAHPRGHALGRIRVARLRWRCARSSSAAAAVVALYQHDLTGRPLEETLGPNASLFVARARARRRRPRRGARRADRPPRARLVGRADPAAGAQHHARRADRDAAPRRGPGGRADPAGGRDRGGGRERQDVLRRGRAGRSSTACSAQSCARCARMRSIT